MNRITNNDIFLTDLDELFQGDKFDVLYSDPPWGVGNLKYWRTMNEQDIVDDWFCFLERIKFLYERHGKANAPLYLETGLRFVKDLEKVFGVPKHIFNVVYTSKKLPNILMIWNDSPSVDLTGKTRLDLVVSALQHIEKGSLIFDPCVGLGTTARACKAIGFSLYANELNKKRMDRTASILPFEVIE